MKNTCGFFIYNKPKQKILFGHVTNSNDWSIPKGKQEDCETLFEAATRELSEEANISIEFLSSCVIHKLSPQNYNHRKKRLNAYLAICDNMPQDIKGISTFEDSYGNKLPEFDNHHWFSVDDVKNKRFPFHETQYKSFLEALNIINNNI